MSKTLLNALMASLLSFIATSCAHSIPNSTEPLYAIYERFIEEAAARQVPLEAKWLDMQFGHFEANPATGAKIIGNCTGNTVTIDTEYWNEGSDLERELVVFHEISHCLGFHEHITDHISIMNPVIMDVEEYMAHRDEYITNLFNDTLNGHWELQ